MLRHQMDYLSLPLNTATAFQHASRQDHAALLLEQTSRTPSNRTASRLDAVLEQINELRAELSDLHTLVEALTSMVDGLVANRRAHDSDPEPEMRREKNAKLQ